MTLDNVESALLTVTSKTKHYSANGLTGNYIVWAEDGQANSVWANNKMQAQTVSGTIDYFTKIENDPNFNAIQTALLTAGISFRWSSTQLEKDTKYIHHEWIFEV